MVGVRFDRGFVAVKETEMPVTNTPSDGKPGIGRVFDRVAAI